jgi:hypothetical protein
MEQITQNQNQPQRPQLLTVLAILSFIGSGLSFLSYFILSFSYDSILHIVETELSELYPEMFADFIRQAGRRFFMLGTLAFAGSLFGVYKMWNLQKEGLHYYAVSQIVILILPLILVSTQLSVLPGLLLTILFILLYYRSFKMMENGK